MISIEHSHASGTRVHGTDGTNLVIQSVHDGWQFNRDLGGWYLPDSHGRDADRTRIERLAEALHAAGQHVEITIDNTRQPAEDGDEARRAPIVGAPNARTGQVINEAHDIARHAMYCRTCRRALNTRSTGGRVTYLHAGQLRGAASDHRPDPVPLTELADPVMECDFCSRPGPAWVYVCADQETDGRIVTGRVVGARDYRDRHGAARVRRVETTPGITQRWGERWSACDLCADRIENRDVYGLISRAADALPAKYMRGNRLARVRGQLHATYTNLLDTLAPGRGRITPDQPLGIWEAH